MAPIKLEDNMKERLEERTIEPTMAAWDKISSQLDIEQGTKKNKRVLWVSIAASFVGGALVALFVFQNMGTDNTSTELVETESETLFVDPTEVLKNKTESKSENLQQIEEAIVQEETTSVKQEVQPEYIGKQDVATTSKNVKTTQGIAQVAQKEKEVKNETAIVSVQKQKVETSSLIKEDENLEKIITENTETVVVQVENKESVTDAEIEALLKNAQRDIISKKIVNQNTNTVDANALLLDVEAEVAPTSFRNKIFDAVVEGFEITRDAVANRNN